MIEEFRMGESTGKTPTRETAIAEKLLPVVTAAALFAERRAKADFTAFDRLMSRKGGELPRPEDALG